MGLTGPDYMCVCVCAYVLECVCARARQYMYHTISLAGPARSSTHNIRALGATATATTYMQCM